MIKRKIIKACIFSILIFNEVGALSLIKYDHHDYGRLHSLTKINIPKIEIRSNIQINEVRFTSYYVGDYSSSGTTTGSGKTTNDFEVNEEGFYTFEGKVVLSAATTECSNSKYGACKYYTEVPDGYLEFSYFDEVNIMIDEIEYAAIVLDSCGASYWPEEKQRIDIFVSDKKYAICKIGEIEK